MSSVTIIGCGIIGLTTAVKLQEKGLKVRIIAKEPFSKTLSGKVGAIWFPFEVYPREKVNHWAQLSYQEFQTDKKPGNGVSFIPFMTAYNEESNTEWVSDMPDGVIRKASSDELPGGIQNAFISIVPLVEPSLYLPYLFQRFIDNDGSFIQREILNLKEASEVDKLVINCTGLGARELCKDMDLHPMRGQILHCKKMNIHSYADSTNPGALSYLINRSEDCVIGGTDYTNDWNPNVDPDDTQKIIHRLLRTGMTKDKPVIFEEMVGLRPKRSEVRFERDQEFKNMFHNYGHGGAGFTVAWGCAIDLANHINEIVSILRE